MSGTASRFQTRFGYAPGLRVGSYTSTPPSTQAPVTGAPAPALPFVPTPTAAPSPLAQLAAPAPAPTPVAAPTPVSAGAVPQDDYRNQMDGAGSSEQAAYGGPGPTGMASTGNFGQDAMSFGLAAGRAAGGLMGSGVLGSVATVGASGLAQALGYSKTAEDIAATMGLQGPITAYAEGQQNPAAYGEQDAGSTEGGSKSDTVSEPNTSVAYGDEFGLGDPNATSDAPTSYGSDFGMGDPNAGTDSGGKGDSAGDGSNSESSPGSSEGGDKGDSGWMRGGYTGAGADGVVQPTNSAGTVHEGEAIMNARATSYYGPSPLLMLNRMQVPRSALLNLIERYR